MDKQKMIQELESYRQKHLGAIELSYADYISKNSVKRMKSALVFWQFVRILRSDYSGEDQDFKDFVFDFVDDKNKLIAFIAKIELLPTRVWRKCLWRYNIDFLSFESFLRRVSSKQMEMMTVNYNDVVNKKKPRVLRARMIDSIVDFFKGVNDKFELFGSKKDVEADRYLTKGAWVNNLASLSFGFALYPNGDLDDNTTNKSGMGNFFSVKNHVNDFIVNQEDGTYWFFYRFTRSYGGMRNWSKVTLSPWICPGFWQTLLTMVWFFVGPIVGLSLLVSGVELLSVKEILAIIAAFPFSVWFAAVLVITLIFLIVSLSFAVANLFSDVDKEVVQERVIQFLKPVLFVVGIILIFLVTSLLVIGIIDLSKWLTIIFDDILLLYPEVYAWLCTGSVLYSFGLLIQYLLYKMDIDDTDNGEKMVHNGWLIKSLAFNVLIALVTVISYFRFEIWDFLTLTVAIIIDNIVSLAFLFLFFYSFIQLTKMTFSTSDKQFLKAKKKVIISLLLLVLATVGSAIYHLDFIVSQLYGSVDVGLVLMGLTIFTIFIIFMVNVDRLFSINPELAEKQSVLYGNIKKEYNFYNTLNEKKQLSTYKRIFENQIKGNTYLTSENLDVILNELNAMARILFDFDLLFRLKFTSLALRTIHKGCLEKLKEVVYAEEGKKSFVKSITFNRFKFDAYYVRYVFMTFFLQNFNRDEAFSLLKDFLDEKELQDLDAEKLNMIRSQKRMKRRKKIFKILKLPLVPFIFLGNVIRDLYEFGVTTSKKSCPYVAQQKRLT
jgi:hypothetical protein